MAAPIKPWEQSGISQQNDRPPCCQPGTNYMSSSISSSPLPTGTAAGLPQSQPPPLPPRPSAQLNTPLNRYGMNGMYGGLGGGMGYSPSSYGMYSSPYSSYGGYGGYGMNSMNRYGMSDQQGTFARHAEESSRPAFESIQSIVGAFTSVSMMLDSTFQAVYSSFQAVIGVADNFSRLKIQMMQFVSALAFIRTLKYMYRRLLELLKLRPPGTAEAEWNQAFMAAAQSASSDPAGKKSSWPILMFFGIILGGPWLIWKLISSFSPSKLESPGWASGEDDHFVADVLHDFNGESNEEVSVKAGERINIAPKEIQPKVRGWLLASKNGETGLVPATYLKVIGKRRGQKTMNSVMESVQQSNNTNNRTVPEGVPNFQETNLTVNDSEMEKLFSSAEGTLIENISNHVPNQEVKPCCSNTEKKQSDLN